eukprot:scaffold957_cov402-Prasinococcus_capsulatus_cf.AAC.14
MFGSEIAYGGARVRTHVKEDAYLRRDGVRQKRSRIDRSRYPLALAFYPIDQVRWPPTGTTCCATRTVEVRSRTSAWAADQAVIRSFVRSRGEVTLARDVSTR